MAILLRSPPPKRAPNTIDVSHDPGVCAGCMIVQSHVSDNARKKVPGSLTVWQGEALTRGKAMFSTRVRNKSFLKGSEAD